MTANQSEIVEALIEANSKDKVVSMSLPNSDFVIAFERHMLDESMARWSVMNEADRNYTMSNVRAALKRGVKKLKKNTAKPKDMDNLAADCALFLAHELMYGDGEKYLTRVPTDAEFRGQAH
jgi:hypothetical protein